MKTIASPITGEEARIIEQFRTVEFIGAWDQSFAIDVSDEFADIDIFYKCLCPSSQYEFFFPHQLQGSAALYEQLSKFHWYYMPNRWEHKTAVEEMRNFSKGHKVLEVGCGRGDFLDLCTSFGINGMGIDINKVAISYGKGKGRNVEEVELEELEKAMPLHFDTVVSFQVLEHITDPLSFLRRSVNLLSPGGALIITVPDGHGFCGRTPKLRHVLDAPPHHMANWNIAAFQFLTKIFPIKLDKIIYEPLSKYHLDWYITELLSNESELRGITRKIFKKIIGRLLSTYAKVYSTYPRWKGHTIFVKFIKFR